jgi:glycerate kinase
MADRAQVPWVAVVGQAELRPPGADVVDLVATFGREESLTRTLGCLRTAARDHLTRHSVPPGTLPVPGPSDSQPGDAP